MSSLTSNSIKKKKKKKKLHTYNTFVERDIKNKIEIFYFNNHRTKFDLEDISYSPKKINFIFSKFT